MAARFETEVHPVWRECEGWGLPGGHSSVARTLVAETKSPD